MPTDNERKALWFLAIVALSGAGVRLYRSTAASVSQADSMVLAGQIGRVDSVRAQRRATDQRPRTQRAGRREKGDKGTPPVDGPPAPTAPAIVPSAPAVIDLDAATAAELETLPGVGPALATRIVQNRDSAGPFGHMDALCEVRGIGVALARKLRPLVTFTGPRRPVSDACEDPSKKARKPRAERGVKPR